MIVLKTLAKRDSEWFTFSLFGSRRYRGGNISVHWWDSCDGEYFTFRAVIIRRTTKRKKKTV